VNSLELNLPSPIELLPRFSPYNEVYIKREGLIHRQFGGNKWRKLKYNIDRFHQQGYQTLVTFGGPFSNHIAATAAICNEFSIPCVGIIRGSYIDASNPTLTQARDNGMILHHIPKEDYKLKEDSEVVNEIIVSYNNPMLIPEGGNNESGRTGMKDLMNEIEAYEVDFDLIAVAAGTGTTASGMISYGNLSQYEILIVNALRNEALQDDIRQNVKDKDGKWQILSEYHFGGYARTNDALRSFAQSFYDNYAIRLDPVYNAKLCYAMSDILGEKVRYRDKRILIIHTGGYQGIDAYDYMKKEKWLDIK
jgi:1-aminocyclopropane-1-carboxylate deaminase